MSTPLTPEVAAWLAEATPQGTELPCELYLADMGARCGSAPTRLYIGGRRCWHHTPDKTTHTKEK